MSSINPNNIDGAYPIAGQDNDSQGFRDNFTNIKNNLTFAQAELADLQQKAVLKAPLGTAGQTATTNILNYEILAEAQLTRTVERTANTVPSTATPTISWEDGNHQRLFLSDTNLTLSFTGWPGAELHTKLRLEVLVANAASTITFPSAVSVGLSSILGMNGLVYTPPTTGVTIFEFSTFNSGATIFAQELTRNRSLRVVDYQYLTPANASLSNVSPTVSTVVVDPAGTIAIANISLPGNTTVSDGQTISFAFGATITALTLFGNGATVLGGLTTAGVTTPAKYIYKTSTNKWYRQG
jgi:hypothetical protein